MNVFRTSVNDLAKACAHSADAAEWGEFLRRCTPLASLVALRVSRMWVSASSQATVEDIVQEVFLKLCEQERRILRDFEPRGEDSFLGLLRMVSASVANDYFRRQYSEKRGGKVVTMPLVEEAASLPAASDHQPAQMQRSVLHAQLDQKLRSAPEVIGERDRALFWLYYLQGLTAEEIARLSGAGLTAKGVESALRRVAKWLRGEVERQKPEEQAESG
ncbi:MAG TPA: sigma-70 family RNA polymerase sigma factor [Terracidiphilus sp.]|nr:sigma-70 family RNA polymerase sigma factor [Terracidiphilus sp.]